MQVVLSSTFCKDEFPNNHGCEFTNYLNQPLDIDDPNETWSVALNELIYDTDFWPQVRKGFNICEIQMGKFDCYVSEFKMIQAKMLTLTSFEFPLRSE